MKVNKKYVDDLLERVLWTCIQASIGVIITASAEWPPIYAAVLATGLAVIKGVAAQHIGDPQTASTLSD